MEQAKGGANAEKRVFIISLAVALLIVLTGIFMRSDYPGVQSSFEHMYAAHEVSGGMWSLAILLAAFLFSRKSTALSGFLAGLPLKIAVNPLPLIFFVTILLAVSAKTVYQGRPLNVDEYSLYFQGAIFAGGKIAGHYPQVLLPWLVPASHAGHFFSLSWQTGDIVTSYWPGFSFLLAPFLRLGVPWLLNPLLTAGSLYLLWLLARRFFTAPEAAGWVLLFSLASPVVTVNALSYYAMTAHLFMNLLYAWLLLELTPLRLLLAGLVGSVALVLHNPVPHLLFALPWIVWIACKPRRVYNLGILFLGYLPLSVLLGFGWVWLRTNIVQGAAAVQQAAVGSAMAAEAVSKTAGGASGAESMIWALLREPVRLLQEIMTLPDLDFLWLRLLGILKIFAWAVPGLPVLAVMGGMRLGTNNRVLRLWTWAAILTLSGYLFVPVSQGHGWGFRYFHSAWAVLPLLATFIVLQPQVMGAAGRNFVLFATLLSLLFGNGMRFLQTGDFIAGHLEQLPPIAKNTGGRMQLVFIDPLQGYYTRDLVQNDPYLRGETIYLISRSVASNREFLQTYFPSAEKVRQKGLHSVWLVDKQDWLNLPKS